jgi:hypothetical protein
VAHLHLQQLLYPLLSGHPCCWPVHYQNPLPFLWFLALPLLQLFSIYAVGRQPGLMVAHPVITTVLVIAFTVTAVIAFLFLLEGERIPDHAPIRSLRGLGMGWLDYVDRRPANHQAC